MAVQPLMSQKILAFRCGIDRNDSKNLIQYSDSITDRTIINNGLYYKRGFSDGIKFILQIAMRAGGV